MSAIICPLCNEYIMRPGDEACRKCRPRPAGHPGTITGHLGPLPRVHPRYFIVTEAKLALSDKFLELMGSHELTYAEAFSILADLTTRLAGMAVKDERREEGETP